MKIVNVEDYFIPDAGYQINIIPKYLAKFGHEVYIVTCVPDKLKKSTSGFFTTENLAERDRMYTEKTGVKIIRVKPLSNTLISGRIIESPAFYKTVKELKPDVVYVHGNDTVTGIRYIKKKKLPFALITDSHMLKMASLNRFSRYFQLFYKKFVTPDIIKKNITVIRTQDDDYVESALGIPLSRAPWISYGTDTDLFHPDEDVKKAFREEHGIPEDSFVFICTGKLDEAKGGLILAEAFKEKFASVKDVTLVTVGNMNGDYGEKVKETFAGSANRIINFPTQKYWDLGKFYQMADACVFARQCSLSFYDAQGCALPIISEDNNINVDRNSHGNGLCFKAEDVSSFREKIEEMLNMSAADFAVMKENSYRFITENYNYEDKAREYEKYILAAAK